MSLTQEPQELRALRLAAQAKPLLAEIDKICADIRNANPLQPLCDLNAIIGLFGKETNFRESINEVNRMREIAGNIENRLRRAQNDIYRFLDLAKEKQPKAGIISAHIKQMTNFPAASFLTADENHHEIQEVEHGLLVQMKAAKPKANKPQKTRPVAVATNKAIAHLQAEGFHIIPGRERYSFLVVGLPSKNILNEKMLDEMERTIYAGVNGIVAYKKP